MSNISISNLALHQVISGLYSLYEFITLTRRSIRVESYMTPGTIIMTGRYVHVFDWRT